MTKLLKAVICGALFVFLLANAAAAKTIRLKNPDSGTQVKLHVGDELEIAVMEIPSTGYRWDIGKHDDFLEYVDSSGKMTGKHRIGAGYWLKFRFRAVSPGNGELRLVQGGREAGDVLKLQVEVAEKSRK